VLDLLQEVDLLEHLAFAKLILHILLLYSLYGHILASQLVHAECDFAEGTLADDFEEFVKLECCRWQFVILGNVILDIADQLVSLLEE